MHYPLPLYLRKKRNLLKSLLAQRQWPVKRCNEEISSHAVSGKKPRLTVPEYSIVAPTNCSLLCSESVSGVDAVYCSAALTLTVVSFLN